MVFRSTINLGGNDVILNNLYYGAVDDNQLGTLFVPGGNSFIDVALVSPAILPDGTDQTSNLHTLLQALQTAGTGGILYFHAGTYKFNSAIIIPNDGMNVPNQVPLVFQGVGSQRSGESTNTVGGTVFDIRTSDSNGHFQTYGLGSLSLRDIQITDGGTSSGNHFFYTTNTTVYIEHCSFIGSPAITGSTANQDAIILGGTSAIDNGTPSAGFQGYGSVISKNQFNGIRRLAYIRVFANGITIENNWIDRRSGNTSAEGSLILIDGTGAGGAPGNYAVGTNIRDNVVEISNYKYFTYIDYGEYTNITGNSLYDSTATTIAGVHCTTNAIDTYIETSLCGAALPYLDGTKTSVTFISQAADGTPSLFPAGVGALTVNGNLTSTGTLNIFGTAGSDNVLRLPQTSGIATFEADGSNVVFRNTGTGSVFFDSASSGGNLNFRSTGSFTNVLNYGTTNAGNWTFGAPLVTKSYTVGTLPSGVVGARAHVTDSNATFTAGIGAVVASGAPNAIVPVFYDGTNWRIG